MRNLRALLSGGPPPCACTPSWRCRALPSSLPRPPPLPPGQAPGPDLTWAKVSASLWALLSPLQGQPSPALCPRVTRLKQNLSYSLPSHPQLPCAPRGLVGMSLSGGFFANLQLASPGEAWVRILTPCLAAQCPGDVTHSLFERTSTQGGWDKLEA